MSDVTFDMRNNSMRVHQQSVEPWQVTLVDTGEQTMTGGRLKRIAQYLDGEDAFCMTYGDGVADVDVGDLIAFHRHKGCLATVTAAHPPGRFGALNIGGDQRVTTFMEKPKGDGGMINAGFFVLSTQVISLIEGDQSIWEREPLEALADQRQLMAYPHAGFWQPMDTLRDKMHLEELWQSGQAPWKVWL